MKPRSSNTFISVVITAFNEEKYLSTCLEALNNQVYPRNKFQVTVVDNNSTDKTAQIAKEFGVRVISEKKQGYVFALKHGMDDAKGDIVAVTDSDTQVANDWLWNIAKAFTDSNVVAITGLIRVNTKSKIINRLMEIAYIPYMYISAFVGKPFLSGWNFAVRRDEYLKVGGLDTTFKMAPDLDLGIRLAKIGKVKIENDLLVCTSVRRWRQGFFPTLLEYIKAYVYAVWLRKPPPVKQSVIR